MKSSLLFAALLFVLPLTGCGDQEDGGFASVDSSYELLPVGDELTLYMENQKVSIGYDVLEPHLEVDLHNYDDVSPDSLPLTGNVFFSVFLANKHTRIYYHHYDSGAISIAFTFFIEFPESIYSVPDAFSSDYQSFYYVEDTSYAEALSSVDLGSLDLPENYGVKGDPVYFYPEEYWLDCSITIGPDGRILSKVEKPESMVLSKVFGGIL